ncbi:MAG: PssD/Cps14F family polysaccharide biosynthesis glycosyltransferase [Nanoarchaeota archaeon]|nr:capsular biosynthesis protein [Nanoarchaeota archaeon]MBU4300103.1 capsular biosynthesis protein [Nanoarchaeota archaeon]MBU4452305.1 capsular biosynthesis protein [Nanoarchaeota archaeon]MCG2723830.1 capsular biosynthesis protein [archaeon]
MKICLACSAGGHLTEIQQIMAAFKTHKTFFITFLREDSKNLENAYFVEDPRRNPLLFIKTIFQSYSILKKENPAMIVTTGAGVAIPACYFAKLMGKRVVFVESFCRVNKPSLSGKLIYPIADLFLVQWEEMLSHYGKKAKYWGAVF